MTSFCKSKLPEKLVTKPFLIGLLTALLVIHPFVSLRSQVNSNLLQNPSFEIFSLCPSGQDQLMINNITTNVPGWINPLRSHASSTDYFNSCDGTNYTGVPVNYFGTLGAFNGNGYAGIVTMFYDYIYTYAEYVQTEVPFFLRGGYKYDIEFRVALAPNAYWATNNMAAYVSTNPLTAPVGQQYFTVPSSPEYMYDPNIIATPGQWVLEHFEYIPDVDGSFYLTIGNFNTNYTNQVVPTGDVNLGSAYYYIDDVSVKLHNGCCPENLIIDNTMLTGTQTYGADNSITIGPNVTTDPNAQISVVAGNVINVNANADLGPNVDLEIGECPGEFQHFTIASEPNVITPNGDGVNDQICVNVLGGETYSVQVFGRFGNLVYASSGQISTMPLCIWDGTCNQGFPNCLGGDLSEGTYNIVLQIDGCELDNTEDAWDVELIRGGNRMQDPYNFSDTGSFDRQIEQADIFSVFPNPTSGTVNIVVPSDDGGKFTLQLIDADGRTVFDMQDSKNRQLQIDVSGLARGTYVIRVIDKDNVHLKELILN